jgi:lipoate-protein ligase B
MRSVQLRQLGLVPYLEAHRLQEALVEQRARGEIEDTLLFLEHPPVITLGRGAKEEHLRFPRASLNQRGIEVHDTGRGGDVTYHGPGQLVAYPIFDLSAQPDVRRYVRNLEEVMIRTVAQYGLSATRIEEKGLEGVWLRSGDLGDRKIGAVGVRISRWITMHGLALNVTTLLSHFGLIVPCGIENKSVTSIELELSGDPHADPHAERAAVPTVADVMPKMRQAFAEVYEAEIHDGPSGRAAHAGAAARGGERGQAAGSRRSHRGSYPAGRVSSASPEPERRRAVLMVVLAASLWGSWSIFLRPTGLSGAVTAPILLVGVALITAPMAWRELAARPVVWTRPLVGALLAYALADAVNVGTFFRAMVTTTVAVAVLTHSVAPVLVSLLAPMIEGTRSSRAPLAASIAVLGLVLVLEPWRGAALDASLLLGAALGLASAVGYAVSVFAARRLGAGVGPGTALSSHAFLSALLLLPLAAPELSTIELGDLGWLLLAILLPGVVAGFLFVRALTVIGSARAAVLALLEPLVACVVGFFAFGERLGSLGAVGGVMVLGAAAYVALERPSVTVVSEAVSGAVSGSGSEA